MTSRTSLVAVSLRLFLSRSMYLSMSSQGTTSLGSSMALSAMSMSGSSWATLSIRLSQIWVQNQSLPAVALPLRMLMVISKSHDSLRIAFGSTPQKGPRSW